MMVSKRQQANKGGVSSVLIQSLMAMQTHTMQMQISKKQ